MKDDIGPWKTMLAGSIGAVVQCTVTFPLDVIKSRIQIQNLNNSLPSVAYEIWRNDGAISFYSGLLPSILRTIPATGALYLVYEHSKTIINDGFKI